MKSNILRIALVCAGLSLARGQTPALAPLPTSLPPVDTSALDAVPKPDYIGFGGAYNQDPDPTVQSRWNALILGLFNVSQTKGIYFSAAGDVYPVRRYDSATGRNVETAKMQPRFGIHESMWNTPSWQALLGMEVAGTFASKGGANVSTDIMVTVAKALTAKIAALASFRFVYTPSLGPSGSWNPVAEVFCVWKWR